MSIANSKQKRVYMKPIVVVEIVKLVSLIQIKVLATDNIGKIIVKNYYRIILASY